jgi:hypothetical protein
MQISPSREIQILDPYLLGIYFSWKQGVKRGLSVKFHQKSKVSRFSKEIPLNFNP